jgi:hypothetical protein
VQDCHSQDHWDQGIRRQSRQGADDRGVVEVTLVVQGVVGGIKVVSSFELVKLKKSRY